MKVKSYPEYTEIVMGKDEAIRWRADGMDPTPNTGYLLREEEKVRIFADRNKLRF